MRLRCSILLGFAVLATNVIPLEADTVNVDLEYRRDTLEWSLYAKIIDTGTGNNGDHGIAAMRALIDNIDFGSSGEAVTILPGIGAVNPIAAGTPNERPAVIMTTGGTVDIVYGQDIADAPSVVGGVGVASRALIMAGTFPSPLLPPAFGDDDHSFTTEGNFLDVAAPGPFNLSLPWNGVSLNVFDITPSDLGGDYNGDGRVDAADYTVWRNNLGGDANAFAAGSRDPLNSGPIDSNDYAYWKSNYGESASGVGGISIVPEPSAIAVLTAVVGALALARRNVQALTLR